MCPDIETFAPLIAAAFGLDTAETEAEHPGHRLRVRLADRALRQVNPLLGLVGRLVQLADSRLEAAAVLDLCGTEPVARKFGFSTEDLDRLATLVTRSGVRWGLDPAHRARFGLNGFGQNTWAAGLDRLLLGIAMDESGQHYLGTALPLDDVDASDVDLVGRFAELLTRLRTVTAGWTESQSVAGWIADFSRAIELMTAVPASETWQLTHAHGQLGRIAEAAGDDSGMLSLPEVAALLTDAFRGRASRANFRTGTLTMCTMLPMRSVPHRVVCLLGADDGVFPRPVRPDGDDIAERDPMVGDRDPRSEDRQLLLDALLAAEERLVVIITGADPRTGSRIPPAVPIGALLDALDTTARTPDGRSVRQQRHRLPSPPAVRPDQLHSGRAGRPGRVQLRPGESARRTRCVRSRPRGAAGRLSRRFPAGAAADHGARSDRAHPLLQPPTAGATPGTRPAVAMGRRRGAGRTDPGRASRAGPLAGRRTAASAAPAGRGPRRARRGGVAPRHPPAARLRRPGAHRNRRRGCRPGGLDRTVPDRRRQGAGRSCSTCRAPAEPSG